MDKYWIGRKRQGAREFDLFVPFVARGSAVSIAIQHLWAKLLGIA
ncbi:hypothetical protein [Nostoc sp. DSM 114161]|jgi:hypothetical protein